MRRVAVKVAYLGKEYCGSQYQPGLRTVVGDIIADLERISGGRTAEWFDIKMAGRTDRGVNALDNVAVFNTTFDDDDSLLKALNSVSKGIFYRCAATVDESFNPRFADRRTYRYVLPAEGIDYAKAERCARLFVGEHDFIRFSKEDGKPTVMELESVETELKDGNIILTFRSRYYLWNMIRKIVAAVSAVGRGERTEDEVVRALNGEDINFGLARADALTLTEVEYKGLRFGPACGYYKERLREERFVNSLEDDFLSSL